MPARNETQAAHTQRLRARLKNGPPLVLDGAGGTALEDQGIDTSGPLWSAHALQTHRPRVVDLHAAYAKAGAQVHTTISFRTHPGLFTGQDGEEAWRATLHSAVDAVEAGLVQADANRQEHWIAGSMAPVGESYQVKGIPDDHVLENEHNAQALGLQEAGVDLLLVETMVVVREARIAVQAAHRTGLPVWVSFVVGDDGRLLSGEPLEAAVEAVQDDGADAVLINCASPHNTTRSVPVLRDAARVPWGAYANASPGGPAQGWGERVGPETYARHAKEWIEQGARIIGSCCGSDPRYPRVLADLAHKESSA